MNNLGKLIMATSLFMLSTLGIAAQVAAAVSSEEAAVKTVIQNAVDAMYNNGNIELIKKYYHPDYDLLLLVEGNQLYKMPLKDRIAHVEQGIENNAFPPEEPVSIRFEIVDVAHSTATVKFDYFRADRQTCIDIMTLYKFKEGWRIVSQTTHHIQD